MNHSPQVSKADAHTLNHLVSEEREAAHFDEYQEEFEQQELRQRMRRASTRADRREHHLAKKNNAPSLGDLIAPGVPQDMRLVFGDPTIVYYRG